MYLIRKPPLTRPWQGDIYKNIGLITDVTYTTTPEGKREFDYNEVTYDFSVILTQECDLEQDYFNREEVYREEYYRIAKMKEGKHDKHISMILMVPAYIAGLLKEGEHLKAFEQKMQRISKDNWKKIARNENKRYHYLKADNEKEIPELVIDFKHYFTISREIFYNKIMDSCYVASLTILFREELSQRFTNYFARIGIPTNTQETQLLTNSLNSGLPIKDFSFQLIPYWI